MNLPIDDDENGLVIRKGMDVTIFDPAYLDHASICDDMDCLSETCLILKTYFQHFSNCLSLDLCHRCQFFFGFVSRHALECRRDRCPTFFCERIKQIHMNMFLSKKECSEETKPGPSSSEPVYLEGCRKFRNLTEKLLSYIEEKKASFKNVRPKSSNKIIPDLSLVSPYISGISPSFSRDFEEDILAYSEFDLQHSTPSTSRDVSQDQGCTEFKCKRFKKEHIGDTIHSMDSSEF
ncbi:hypothetical protein TNCT_515991 [Trichonephila clavata]|uniref:TAZ-type domain-containing protein n=1 Tax=Trichonephila clavata TaxID=2740835 RepID=A0A8X6GUD2_TRICU|nr:hypothetical protein TNCT_515991 [Trichonephila clavata]